MPKKKLDSEEKYLVGGSEEYQLYYDSALNTVGVSDGNNMFKVDLNKLGNGLFKEEENEA